MTLQRTPDHFTGILTSTVLVFGTSLIAERVHASPVIAVVVAGLVVGRAARRALEPSRVLALQGFWEVAGFGANVLLFLLVGMQLDARVLVAEAQSILFAVLALHAGRAVAVYGCFAVLRAAGKDSVPMRWQHVMVFGNIKGALSMAAVLALPAKLPHRAELVAIVFGVTFVTLLTQALPFRRVLHMLGVALASVVGRSVSDLANDAGFPRSCVIAGIALDGAVRAPRGATVIEAGAELLVISARADLTRAIAMFLESAPAAAERK